MELKIIFCVVDVSHTKFVVLMGIRKLGNRKEISLWFPIILVIDY